MEEVVEEIQPLVGIEEIPQEEMAKFSTPVKDEPKCPTSEDEAQDATPETPKEIEEEGPGKIFEFADIYFYCSKCGNDKKIAEGLKGISYTVGAAERSEVKMECTECGNVIKLYFKESSDEVKDVKRAELEARIKEEKNGTSQENTDEQPEQGVVADPERTTEANEEATGVTDQADAPGQDVEA